MKRPLKQSKMMMEFAFSAVVTDLDCVRGRQRQNSLCTSLSTQLVAAELDAKATVDDATR